MRSTGTILRRGARELVRESDDFRARAEPFQQALYELLVEKLKRNAVSVVCVEHDPNQEAYYLASAAGEVKLRIDYKSGGFVNRVAPEAYSAPAVVEAVKDALGF